MCSSANAAVTFAFQSALKLVSFASGFRSIGYRIEGNWKEVKGKIKEKWGQRTDDDLAQ